MDRLGIYIFWVGGGGGGGGGRHQSVSPNMKKDLHKANDFIDNNVIILRSLSFVLKYTDKKIQLTPLSMVISW